MQITDAEMNKVGPGWFLKKGGERFKILYMFNVQLCKVNFIFFITLNSPLCQGVCMCKPNFNTFNTGCFHRQI